MDPCSHCHSRLETPLVCLSCHRLVPFDRTFNPYVSFGLPFAYDVDKDLLKKQQSRLTRLMHPDYFGGDPEARALAERNTSELNQAYETLKDDATRADWLVRELGGPSQDDLREMPREFLMEVLEWNETLEEARGTDAKSAQRARLAPLRAEIAARRATVMERIGRALDPLPERGSPRLADVRKDLNAVRYLDRALSELSELLLFCTPR